MEWGKEYLDLLLVPSGMMIMFGYHLWLLYRYIHLPHTTVFGYENNDKKAWVDKILQVDYKDKSIPLSVISTNITAATFLASVSLTLCSLIGVWIANNSQIFQTHVIYGDTRLATMSIKYITLLVCFLLAFSCFVQSFSSFVHANYLISLPNSDVPLENVELAVIRGGDFWALGLRAIYFALCMLMWFFGPIPMFATSASMVVFLHFLDTNKRPLHWHRSTEKGAGKRATERVAQPA